MQLNDLHGSSDKLKPMASSSLRSNAFKSSCKLKEPLIQSIQSLLKPTTMNAVPQHLAAGSESCSFSQISKMNDLYYRRSLKMLGTSLIVKKPIPAKLSATTKLFLIEFENHAPFLQFANISDKSTGKFQPMSRGIMVLNQPS
ncbi:hypothetical protein PGT21_003472 [Puccinia graminis f. sp. tritici]|uniref:Uncharacterized protein n=1 Tax=Puccinia graminis f. sp. tritici TaxID=56615 RepID=A0A5B0N9R7_PUCGR|nr:hypothetical protein PGT21_003472 [Puccinia graminis f. sp. tritici]